MKVFRKEILFGVMVSLLLPAVSAWPGTIGSTKHNLSVSGTGEVAASTESQICIFCHIPHRENSNMPYLWNRSDPSNPYTPYNSSTLKADVGQPTGSSRMCLSCHDGTIALGAVASMPTEIPFRGGIRYLPADRASNLGTDLSDDHPVSFEYDTALSQENMELRDPLSLPPNVRLEDDVWLQCTTCHDPHDDTFGRFLVMDNTASALCLVCHDEKGWPDASHSRSNALLDRAGGLWPNTDAGTVAANGCENCHPPHSAGAGERLMYFANEEENCLVCHDGGIASSDIAAAVTRQYSHSVQNYTGVHDAAEDFSTGSVPKHVECSDCHDAHQANEDPSVDVTLVSGATRGASGISASGATVTEARYVYEICFKCHGDSSVIETLPVTRQIDQLNTRLEFDPANPSFHPVAAPGKNPNVSSLLPPYSEGSVIGCTDCHGNSDSLAASGPHGSDHQYLLTDRYVTEDYTSESPFNYALCYKCHSRPAVLDGDGFPHRLHTVDQKTPCSACHDPHGVSYMQGNALRNSHLINFDLSIVSPNDTGRLEYQDQGQSGGKCYLNCHGKPHDPASYP